MAELPLLDIRDLTVEFATRHGVVRAVEHVDISVAKGETIGIVGESGSGKSVTSFAVLRILDRAGHISKGSIHFTGLDVRAASEGEMRNLRGREISMIFQNPRAALNPIRKVGHQIEDVLEQHAQVDSTALTEKAIDILDRVRIARPRERYHAYPFELSGGMCQRVVIALALACRPQLLIADEPTTGLDVTTQKTVMDLVVELTRERGMSTILITHDLGLAANYCDRVFVMEKGRVVESAASKAIFTAPVHPYTRKLMRATPRPGVALRDLLPEDDASDIALPPAAADCHGAAEAPLLVVEKLIKEYPRKGGAGSLMQAFRRKPAPEPEMFRAVDGISFKVDRGESVGLVGESGCGKSTTSTMVMRLIDKTDGVIMFDARTSAPFRRVISPACRCASASRWSFRTRPTASTRGSQPRARLPTRYCGSATSRGAQRCVSAARSSHDRWDCRSTSSIVFRTSSRAGRRRASASRAQLPSALIW